MCSVRWDVLWYDQDGHPDLDSCRLALIDHRDIFLYLKRQRNTKDQSEGGKSVRSENPSNFDKYESHHITTVTTE